ncbi:MAG: hypothetical protein ACLT3D_00480 [Lawsonibacter sp.]
MLSSVELSVIGAVAAALFAAAVVAFITTPVVRSLAFKIGAVDVPRDNRRMHNHPIPRMGGLAIFFGFILSALIFIPLTPPPPGDAPGGCDHRHPGHLRRYLRPARHAEIPDPDPGRPHRRAHGQPDRHPLQPQHLQQ